MSATTHAIGNMSLARPIAGSVLLRRVVARLMRAHAIRVRRRLLRELPDYLLKDIGLSRSDIDYVAQAIVDGRDDPTRQHSFRGSWTSAAARSANHSP
jgi:uncharacterized protein YjiS (DUF1127 family)